MTAGEEDDDTLTIQEAMNYLGCSERTIQRLTRSGDLNPGTRFDAGKKQNVNTYSRLELRKAKEARDNPKPPLRTQVLSAGNRDDELARADEDDERHQELGARALNALLVRVAEVAAREAAHEVVQGLERRTRPLPFVDVVTPGTAAPTDDGLLPHKVLLTVEEVRRLSGLSREFVRNAIRAGNLKARRIGRSDRIKRQDFDAWIESL